MKNQIDIAEYNMKVVENLHEQKYEQALPYLNQIIEADPRNIAALSLRAICLVYLDRPNYAQATKDYNRIIKLDPNNLEAYLNRGQNYMYQTIPDFKKAISDFSVALTMDPYHKETLRERASAYYSEQVENYAAAIEDINTLEKHHAKLDYKDAEAFYIRGISHLKISGTNFTKAFADFAKAIKLNPDMSIYYYTRAYWCQQLNQCSLTEIVKDLDKALGSDPMNIEVPSFAWLLRGQNRLFLAKQKNNLVAKEAEIRADIKHFLMLRPQSSEGHTFLGLLEHDLQKSNWAKLAISHFNTAIKYNKLSAVAYLERGKIYATKSDPDFQQALNDFNQAIKLDSGYLDAYTQRAGIYMQKSNLDYETAILDLTKVLLIDPNDVAALFNRASCYVFKTNPNYDIAMSDVDQIIIQKTQPENQRVKASAYFLKATIHTRLKKYQQAIEDHQAAIAIDDSPKFKQKNEEQIKTLIQKLK